jgi:hypothetical protein
MLAAFFIDRPLIIEADYKIKRANRVKKRLFKAILSYYIII